MMDKGCLVISLDFELLWGGLDIWTPEDYGKSHVVHVREAIHRMVALFKKYEAHATFATVGFLMLEDTKEIKAKKPEHCPSYQNEQLNPYGPILDTIRPKSANMYFAPDVIKDLQSQPFIEIGTHTFSHFYCWENGQTLEQFEADIKLAVEVAKEKGITLKSIVFPRNQVSKAYLEICEKYGILSYRGNARKYYDHTTSPTKGLYYRLSRLIDTYVNWGGHMSIAITEIIKDELPMSIPASRMLRPYMKSLRWFESLRLHRIKKEMEYAAKHHELYHLWWHPHNFGADMEENLAFLEKVLRHYQYCHRQYGMCSMTMNEFHKEINK